ARHRRKAMKTLLSALAGLAMLAGASVPGNAQIFENGPYYSVPSWDQQIPATQRFIVLTNFASAAVLDRETGLVWERSPSQTAGFLEAALTRCKQLTTGGRGGWRLPRVEE